MEPLPAPKVLSTTSWASSSALDALLELARNATNGEARSLADKIDQERKVQTMGEAPGQPVAPPTGTRARDTGLGLTAILENSQDSMLQMTRGRSPTTARGTGNRMQETGNLSTQCNV
eukprot:1130729-Amphidinium_carterae.1